MDIDMDQPSPFVQPHFRQGGNLWQNLPNQQQNQALPPVLSESGPSTAPQPRRSGRTRRQPAPQPGDVYGGRTPLQRQQLDLRTQLPINEDTPEQSSADSPVAPGTAPIWPPPPLPSQQPDTPPTGSAGFISYQDLELILPRLAQEGGAPFINFLLAQAIPSDDERDKSLPQATAKVREWHYRDILQLPKVQKEEWKKACHEELESLRERRVFELTDLPKGRRVVKNRWVFDIKSDGRKKARLVAKGFSQQEGIDFNEIFSPVVRFETVRLMLALSALTDMHMEAVDVKTAFLYGKLDEEIYMQQPEGFKLKGQETKVLRLLRAIYGLKQAALAWWKELESSMKRLGFKRTASDAGVFFAYIGKNLVIIIVYVDDAIFFGKNLKAVKQAKQAFMGMWECRDLGEAREFLRMKIRREGSMIYLDQTAYLNKIVERFGMSNARGATTPLPGGYVPEESKGQCDPATRQLYQSIIGSLLYIMLGTRPDITYAVTKLAQFSVNPSKDHIEKAKYILRYLNSTSNYAMVFDGSSDAGLIAYTDSDWAADVIKRRSITGYFFKLANGIFSWQSRAQKTVALSSTEAEYMALSDTSRQAVWIQSLLKELGIVIPTIPICGDNQGSIFIGSNPVQERRSKHIDIRYHYVRQLIEEKKVELFFVEGAENPADLFTKNLAAPKFLKFREQLGLEFYSS